tara:strand:+ start:528 stop:662 length:135 start_codon:yes stop_codon:yes gene_type:complete
MIKSTLISTYFKAQKGAKSYTNEAIPRHRHAGIKLLLEKFRTNY